MILEYKMDRDYDGILRTPSWIECGGFLQNPVNKTLIGFSPAVREYKIPDSALVLTELELKERVRPLGYVTEEGVLMTEAECDALVEATILANDL
jgi:hypothetical protein